MEKHARIGHLTVCKGAGSLRMGKAIIIGNLNWITGQPVFESFDKQRQLL